MSLVCSHWATPGGLRGFAPQFKEAGHSLAVARASVPRSIHGAIADPSSPGGMKLLGMTGLR